MTGKFIVALLTAVGLSSAATEAEVQLAYWQAAAKATAAQAALRNSMSDAQKQMEAQRDAFGAQAEAARKKMGDFCVAKKEVLDVDTFECKATAPVPTPEVKK